MGNERRRASEARVHKRKAPDRREVDETVRSYRRTHDSALRDRLISQHLYLVQTVARKFAGLGESNEDLLQEGAMGLINAVDLYDPERGVQFSTYATHLVEGHIRHYLRDKGKLIKQPAWVQELTTKIIKASDALTQELDRQPTPQEIAERVGTTPENVTRMLEARERSKVASLDAASMEDDGQAPAVDPEKLSAARPDEVHLPIEDRIFLRDAMGRLKSLERKVVHYFYYLDLNQTEIARKLGISVNYASYLLRGAVAKLRKAVEAQEQAAGRPSEPGEHTRAASGEYSLSLRPTPTDPATKLPTEGHFVERLHQEVERARRYPQQFAILVLSPDREDLSAEDRAGLARLLRANVRSIDLVARLRGGSFGLLLPHTGREAGVLAERIVRMVAGRLGGNGQPLTVSVGIAAFPGDGRGAEELLCSAGGALEEARGQGGNCFVKAHTRQGNGGARATA
jgi:RNA polymerase sigma-B factor